MTHATTEFPDSHTSLSYNEAIEEAVDFYKRTGSKEIPKEILEKAIGVQPPYCDSSDPDTMLEAYNSFTSYRKKEKLFFQRVEIMSQ